MTFKETFRVALRGLSANRLRTALTMLGIAIGVGAVILLVAVGTGSSKAVQDSITSLWANTLTVSKSASSNNAGGFGNFGRGRQASNATRNATLTTADITALQNTTDNPDVVEVAPVVNASSVTAAYEGTTYSPASFVGSSPAYAAIRSYTVSSGAFFTDADVADHSKVIVIGQTVATELFGRTSAVGKQVKMGDSQFTVAGVLTSKGTNGTTDQDDIVIAPYTSVQDVLTGYLNGLDQIIVQAKSQDAMTLAEAEITDTLRTTHRLSSTETVDFSILNQQTLLATSTSTTKIFTVLLAAVAGISLLVGGIGVMNIMLVTVTERTREIGIRKAIGARKADVVGQFLTEAVLLSVLGGLLGVAVGVIGSQFMIAGVDPVIAPYSVALAFGVSVAIGLFFGLYPANRAAGLRPIEALRYE